nr:MAG TPA: bacteriocin [Crassvirales sp.]
MAKRKVKSKIGLPYNRFGGEGESMNMIQKSGAVADDAFGSSNLGGTIGSIGSGVTSIVQAGMNNAQIADTSSIQDQIKAQNNMVVGASDNASLLNEWSNLSMLKDNYSWKDIRGGSNANRAMNTIGGAAQGAMTGATVGGPIGAIAGAVIGLGSGIAGWITGNKKAKRRARRLNQQASDANERALLSFENRASDVDTQNDLNIASNFFNDGGPITMRYTGVMSPFGNTFGDGGIFIKPENRGKFTALKERTGKSSTWYKEHGTPAQKKMAIFALNAAKWKHADGGELHTHGGDFTNGITFIDNGGTHEANPFEGVQMGIDPQGVPNLVEEGEVIFNDYVFSDRMKLPKKLKEKYNIKGETFADAAKELSRESDERPNDPISKRGLQAFMSALANGQEEMRIKDEDRKMNRYAKGGRLGNLFDGTGNKSNRLNPYSNFVPLTDDSFYTPEYMNFWNWYNTNQDTPKGQTWLKRINSGEFGPIGGNTFAPQDIIRLSHDYKKGPVHNAFAAAAKQYTVENPKEDPYTPYTKRWIREKGADGEWRTQQITDAEWNSAPAGRTYLMRNPNLKEGNTVTSDRGDKDIYYDVIPEELPEELTGDVTEVKGIRQNPLRYVPLIGSGTAVLNDIFGGNDPDYSNADMFASAISSANRPIGTRPIGEYLAYKPLDRMFYINQLNKDTAAGRRAIQDTSGGNRAAALAGILAADYNYGENLGKLARQAEEYNQALKEKVTGFNRQTNMFNSEQGTKVDMFNSELLGKQASLYGQLADMKQKILEGNRAEKSANLTNFIQGLGDLGRELTDRDTLRWLADIGALPYNTRGQYTGGNNTAAPKKSKSGKINRNKKKGYTI